MPGSIELRVLGGLGLEHGGELRSIGGPKMQGSLSVLLSHRGEPVSSDRLIEALWGDRPPRTAAATVQSQISRLRGILAPGFSIALDASGYRLDVDRGTIDAVRFEGLLARSRTVDAERSIPILEAGLALWRGAAFGACAELAEVHGEAVRLDELRLVATDAWASAKLATGDPALMVSELEALVSVHPLRESFWKLLMLALYRVGRQAEALRRAQQLREVLGDEIGLDVSPAVRALEAQILADDPTLVSKDGSQLDSPATAVAVPLLLGATSFIGRDPDLARLGAALRDQSLITITGPGGVGKTRLAMRLAATVATDFDHGVEVVEFAPLRDPSGVAQVIANALDIQQRQYRTIESTIEDHLVPANCLLVLDNCEHLTTEVARLVDHLRSACPRVRFLATSREPLGLAGEYVQVLAPLELPDCEAERAEEVNRSAAVELFVARAETATPGFALSDDNAASVADLCRRLDGLPLALELGAARLRTMGVEALAAQLHLRLELLGQTQRGAAGRHRSLHHLVEWSYDLLTDQEQETFERLAIFAAGFDLAAAEAICSTASDDPSAVGTLASLVDKSMVVLVDPLVPRYRLLEPLREFGLDRLRARGRLDETEDGHRDWFLDLAERAQVGLDGPEEAAWSAQLDRDFDNLRAAHVSAIRHDRADTALRLVAALREYAFRRIRYEVMSWAEASIPLEGSEAHPDLATVLAVSAYGQFVRGDMDAAVSLANRAVEQQGDPTRGESEPSANGLAERVLGNALFYLDRPDQALGWMDRMLLSARHSGSNARLAHALYMRSVALTSMGDGIRGAVMAGEAKAAAAAAGSPTAHAEADYALGLAIESSDAIEALRLLEGASAAAAAAGNRWIESFSLTEVYWLRAKLGEHMRALVGFAEVVDTWYRGGDWANQWLSLRRVLGIFIHLGAVHAAAVLHGALTAVGASHALPFEPVDAERLARDIERVRSLLGPAEFAKAVRHGASMNDGDIVGHVRHQMRALTD